MNLESISSVYDLFLAFFLFIALCGFASWLIYIPTASSRWKFATPRLQTPHQQLAIAAFSPLACLLEDAPETSLNGQFYPFATSLMTPLACLLEDVPAKALTGQSYALACIVTQTWQQYYRANLGKPGINYWQWQGQPEVDRICPELSLLLKLPKPQGSAQEVLQILARHQNYNTILTTPQRLAWQRWQQQVLQLIDKQALADIYRVCYRVSWRTVQHLILTDHELVSDEIQPWWKVLGVKPSADSLQVENAYKKLLRKWHPDLNHSPYATEITSRLNLAYEQYQNQNIGSLGVTNRLDHPFVTKIRQWFR